MPNPVQAAAEGMSAVTRRTFLAGAVVAPMASMPALAAASSQASEIDRLLMDFIKGLKLQKQLSEESRAAYESMPAWAKAGPEYLDHRGEFSTGAVGWPQVEPLPEPSEYPGVLKLIRPNPRQVWKDRTRFLTKAPMCGFNEDGTIIWGVPSADFLAHRRHVRLAAFAAVKKVLARVRQQREERRKAGLDVIDARMDAVDTRQSEMEQKIRMVAAGTSHAALAAQILMEVGHWCTPEHSMEEQDDSVSWVQQTLLSRLAPHLTGFLRVVVDDFVDGDQTRSFEETIIGGSVPLSDGASA